MNKTCINIAFGALATFSAASALAVNWVPKFSFDTDATYDDNFLMRNNGDETWIYSVRPEVSLTFFSPVVKSEIEAKLAVRRYSEFDQFDSEDPSIHWKNSYKTERTTWRFDTGYSENSQRDAAEQDTGLFDSNTIVETISADPSVVFRATEKDDVGLSLSYVERNYDGDDFADNFADNDNKTVGLNWQHKVDEVLSTTANVSASQYYANRPNVGTNQTDYERITAGFIYQYSEALTIDGSAGYFQTDSEERPLTGPVALINRDSTGLLLNVALKYSLEKTDWTFSLSRGLYPSSQGIVEEQDRVGLGYEHKFSTRSSSGIDIAWYKTDAILENRESVRVSPYYHYQLTPKLKLQTAYIFRTFDRDLSGQTESNQLRVGLRYSF